MKKSIFLLICVLAHSIAFCQKNLLENKKWKKLFNGKDLAGWDIKIAGSELNVNYKNTFKVVDGAIQVNYDNYKTFDEEYGHLYYQTPYSHYILRVEYRFTGNQTPGGASWNVRNSGVMIHSQSAKSMGKDQSFPISLEVQFLGGLGNGARTTANLCTPGTTIQVADTTFTDHILNSKSKTYDGDQWVTVDIIVLGDSIIHHVIDNDTVLTYIKPKIGGGFVHKGYDFEKGHVPNPDVWINKDGTPLKSGYISLQAESHPIEFRKVDILVLKESVDTLIHNESVNVTKISDLPMKAIFKSNSCSLDRLFVFINDGSIDQKKIKSGDCRWVPKGQNFSVKNTGNESLTFFEIALKDPISSGAKFKFPQIDPVKIEPKYYTNTFENNQLRVVMADFPPGVKIKMHEHNNQRVIIFLTDHSLKLYLPTGEVFNVNDKAGTAFFAGSATHAEENISKINVKTMFVDLKK